MAFLLMVGVVLFMGSWAAAFLLHSLASLCRIVFLVFAGVFAATIIWHRVKARLLARKRSRLISSWISQLPKE